MSDIPEGYGIIAGRSRANAQSALDAAKAAGLEPNVVTAVPTGYLVPDAVLAVWQEANQTAPDETEVLDDDHPTSDWKNADIEAWAEDHGVDLGGATKKADMLDAIASAQQGKE